MNSEMKPDEHLVEQARKAPQGDTMAFEHLVQRHQASILANCKYLTRSPDDAEDLAQEVFVKAFFRLDSFEGRSHFKTWLQQIKINHCLNFIKRRQGKRFVDIAEPGLEEEESLHVQAGGPTAVAGREERERINTVLESLPDHMRIPLVLCDVDGLSYQEIVDTLQIGMSAVKMRIKRAREEFRRRYSVADKNASSQADHGEKAVASQPESS